MNDESRLGGKVAVVTGASKGIGAAIARRLWAEGASVALLARSGDLLTALAEDLGVDRALAIRCHVGNPDDVRSAFAAIRNRFGSIDVLINNAGLIEMSLLGDASDQSITEIVSTNLLGAIFCSREAIPLIKESGGGHIVNISSRSVELARPYLSVYSATKGGLEVFARTLAAELRPDRISVSTIRIGPTASEPAALLGAQRDRQSAITAEWVARGGPAPEPPAPVESVADAVVFVCTQVPGTRVPSLQLEPE
jgi:meso-butanediol dehydrogenase / (S,S)-butanediol dehydrogenase / diacetyl reductase